ncbi:MDR family NADP-dependent oxidoreductase [Sphaerisporangium corydalis]|uniref:Zinc-binding dehydrogenase n=1 Tax=Sphaerisporangium corydalis TaxID=1441875 RepID=A0ABV9ED69_9ACTN|nr:NADP-dependent oxidoreductase [Sphaerisporangium corydalis]
MSAFRSHEVRLAARPPGAPGPEHFAVAEVAVPRPGPGEVLVRNRWMPVSAVMLSLVTGAGPMPPYEVGRVLHGPAIGEVLASGDPDLSPGDHVSHGLGWREHAVGEAGLFRRIGPVTTSSDAAVHLGQGLTAYVGLRDVAAVRPGDTVFVTGAAGAAGSAAGLIARLLGAGRVVGGAGSAARARELTAALGFDAAFDRHDGPVAALLRQAAPGGVDVVFDTVGGEHLRAAVGAARPGARVALCGALAHQLGGARAETGLDLMTLIGRRVTLRGFTASDHPESRAAWIRDAERWRREGRLALPHTVVDGLAGAPGALLGLPAAEAVGVTLIRL